MLVLGIMMLSGYSNLAYPPVGKHDRADKMTLHLFSSLANRNFAESSDTSLRWPAIRASWPGAEPPDNIAQGRQSD